MMEIDKRSRPTLLILGVHKACEGYPNVLYRLKSLYVSQYFNVSEINISFWEESSYRNLFSSLPRSVVRALIAHLRLMLRFVRAPAPDLIYVPYPGIFVLAVLSMLPRRNKCVPIIADAFISVHDTVVHDRGFLERRYPLARMLHWLEKRGYNHASQLIVDTPENAAHLCQTFNLPPDKVVAVPLSTNEVDYRPSVYQPHTGSLRVLFIGTLVPLHGATAIVEAAACLRHHSDIEFRMIGDGQDAPDIERLIVKYKLNLVWLREWQTPERLAKEIERADICLGIFGKTAKAQRVCPFKIYAYATVGRSIITGETEWLRNMAARQDPAPFASVPIANPVALADKILELAKSPSIRFQLAVESRRFYEKNLANKVASRQLLECLRLCLPT